MNKEKYDLIDFRKTYYSQYGEEGIIEKILSELKIDNGFCVEFGAGDGLSLSATKFLLDKGWSGILIEPDIKQFEILKNRYNNNNKVKTLNCFVEISGKNKLDNILENNNSNKDIDFMSIDVDGNDYLIWESLQNFQPKIIQIESNFTMPPNLEFVQKPNTSFGNSVLALYYLGIKKGYKMVCYNMINCFFVRNDLYNKLNLYNSSYMYIYTIGVQGNIMSFFISDYNGNWHSLVNYPNVWGLNKVYISNTELIQNAHIINLVTDKKEIKKLFESQ